MFGRLAAAAEAETAAVAASMAWKVRILPRGTALRARVLT